MWGTSLANKISMSNRVRHLCPLVSDTYKCLNLYLPKNMYKTVCGWLCAHARIHIYKHQSKSGFCEEKILSTDMSMINTKLSFYQAKGISY